MATVIISYHDGIVPLPVVNQTQQITGGAYALSQPQITSESVTSSGTAASSTGSASSKVKIAHVQVQDGSTIRYVWNPPGYSETATASKPALSGHATFPIGPSWTLSVIDA